MSTTCKFLQNISQFNILSSCAGIVLFVLFLMSTAVFLRNVLTSFHCWSLTIFHPSGIFHHLLRCSVTWFIKDIKFCFNDAIVSFSSRLSTFFSFSLIGKRTDKFLSFTVIPFLVFTTCVESNSAILEQDGTFRHALRQLLYFTVPKLLLPWSHLYSSLIDSV